MTTTSPRLLPLISRAHAGGRSAMTCRYRCGDACFQEVPNTSESPYFGDLMRSQVSRRTALKAGGVGAAALTVAWGAATPAAAAAAAKPGGPVGDWAAIPPTPATTDAVVVPQGYSWAPIISWGDPVAPGAPDFDFWNQTFEAQAGQAGYNADYVTLFYTGDHPGPVHGANEAILAFNNEYTNDELMFPAGENPADLTVEQLKVIMAAHGMTIVDITRRNENQPWTYRRHGEHNRRIHAWTPFRVDGPAAGAAALRTSADPTGALVLGMLNNCSGGHTPWGTALSGEENVNQYFRATGAPDPQGRLARYGITSGGRGWERVDQRFDVVAEPNEVNRFGWICEIDPSDPTSQPVKHTAMGRFKHEGANIHLADSGHAVAYMGDDERFEYIYKFVSAGTYVEGDKEHNKTLLSEGNLYVARFTGDGFEDGVSDGTGQWLPLVVGGASQVPGMSVEEVLIWTRAAADVVVPTKMDRPEDVEPHPFTGKIYAALTNNTARQPGQIDEPNPRAANKHGQVLEISEDGGDNTGTTFHWQLVLIAGDPDDPTTYFYGFDKSQVSPISCPDNVAFDDAGNLWISTDGQGGTLGNCDGLYRMPLSGPERGHLQQFLSVPVGAECCGPYIGDQNARWVLVAVQHPGEVDGASTSNVVSTYPYQGNTQPRPGVMTAWRRGR